MSDRKTPEQRARTTRNSKIARLKNMGKLEFIRYAYYSSDEKPSVSMRNMSNILECMTDIISDCIVDGEFVYLRGFGTFVPIAYASKYNEYVYNPYTQETIEGRNIVYNTRLFRYSKELICKINGVKEYDTFEEYFGSPLHTD
jgi:nucleoid DNA-binding protein